MTAKIDGTNGLLQQYDYQVLTTGFSYTFAAGVNVLVINPAGTLATGTITMPAAPVDGMTITFSSTQTITALTLSGNTGQTVVGGPTTLLAGQASSFVYRLASTSWFPLQTVPSANTQLGIGQSWTDVTASRTSGITYTNSTSKPIAVSAKVSGSPGQVSMTVSGIQIQNAAPQGINDTQSVFGIVPPGATYTVTAAGTSFTLVLWAELR